MFFIFEIFRGILGPTFDFAISGVFFIPSVDLEAKTRLIIYLQPCSESMTLGSLISWISPRFPKILVFEFIQNRKENP
jgi:hypothetical protein